MVDGFTEFLPIKPLRMGLLLLMLLIYLIILAKLLLDIIEENKNAVKQ
jgi:hypothetical protein